MALLLRGKVVESLNPQFCLRVVINIKAAIIPKMPIKSVKIPANKHNIIAALSFLRPINMGMIIVSNTGKNMYGKQKRNIKTIRNIGKDNQKGRR
jgi:hypothetical protein